VVDEEHLEATGEVVLPSAESSDTYQDTLVALGKRLAGTWGVRPVGVAKIFHWMFEDGSAMFGSVLACKDDGGQHRKTAKWSEFSREFERAALANLATQEDAFMPLTVLCDEEGADVE
jgi:hypothetical protein